MSLREQSDAGQHEREALGWSLLDLSPRAAEAARGDTTKILMIFTTRFFFHFFFNPYVGDV